MSMIITISLHEYSYYTMYIHFCYEQLYDSIKYSQLNYINITDNNNCNMKKDYKNTITITFGDQAENHVGMQKIGKMANEGFTFRIFI